MERKILVYENFSSSEPKKLGILYVDTLRGIEHYSFEYDQDWLKQSKFLLIYNRVVDKMKVVYPFYESVIIKKPKKVNV